jgi:hypothetical protein
LAWACLNQNVDVTVTVINQVQAEEILLESFAAGLTVRSVQPTPVTV